MGQLRKHMKRNIFHRIRYLYFKMKLEKCGNAIFFEKNVQLMRFPENISLGDELVIKEGSRICSCNKNAKISIGKKTTVGYHSFIFASEKISIGENCLIAPFTYIVDSNHEIKKGLNIPINGSPTEEIVDSTRSRSVAILGNDYVGMKPTMLVEEGERVKLGQALFEDKKNPGVIFTSPAGGKVESINRGDRRVLQSVVIEVDQEEETEEFNRYTEDELDKTTPAEIRSQLIKSGSWTAFRTRPYSKIPGVEEIPNNIFISLLDTQPLSPNPEIITNLNTDNFNFGLKVLKRLVDCPIHISTGPNSNLDLPEDDQVIKHIFSGPHPAGLVGTQMHYISPASLSNINWTIGYQDVIAIGAQFRTGKIFVERVVSLAGPQVNEPKYLKTRLVACTDEVPAGQ